MCENPHARTHRQSLYVPYSGYVLDHCSAWLKRFEQESLAAVAVAAQESSAAVGTADEPRKKKRSKAREGADIADAATRWAVLLQVWRALLGTLHKAFLFDHDRTRSVERPCRTAEPPRSLMLTTVSYNCLASRFACTDYFDRERFDRLVDPIINQLGAPALLASPDYPVRLTHTHTHDRHKARSCV